MSQKISIDRTELMRLRLVEAIAPHVHHRRMHSGTTTELVSRAIESGAFRLGEDGALIGDSVADFLNDVEASASYLFQSWDDQQRHDAKQRQAESDAFLALPAEKRLAIVNERIAAERAAKAGA